MEEATQSQSEQNVEQEATQDVTNSSQEEQENQDTIENESVKENDDNNADSTEETEQKGEEDVTDDFELDVKYNKQNMSLNKEDATKYAQMGLKYESLEPMMSKLKFLAASDNKSISDFVDTIVQQIDDSKKSMFREKAGDDEEIFNALVEADKLKNKKAYDELLKSEKEAEEKETTDEVQNLAEEFKTLQKEIPELKQFEEVPDEVIKIRDKNNITLYDAYLRYERQLNKTATANAKLQKANAETSIGSIKGVSDNGKPQWEKDLLEGIWG